MNICDLPLDERIRLVEDQFGQSAGQVGGRGAYAAMTPAQDHRRSFGSLRDSGRIEARSATAHAAVQD